MFAQYLGVQPPFSCEVGKTESNDNQTDDCLTKENERETTDVATIVLNYRIERVIFFVSFL